jgi:hypothetical protein
LGLCLGQSPKTAKPDLSGTWEFDAARSNFKSKQKSPEQIKITHHEPELIIRRKVKINDVSQERDLTYYTDGRGETNPTPTWMTTNQGPDSNRPFETTSKTTWSKDKIVTRSVSGFHAGITIVELEIIDEFRLSPDGKTLTDTRRTVRRNNMTPNAAFVVESGADFKTAYKLISK